MFTNNKNDENREQNWEHWSNIIEPNTDDKHNTQKAFHQQLESIVFTQMKPIHQVNHGIYSFNTFR